MEVKSNWNVFQQEVNATSSESDHEEDIEDNEDSDSIGDEANIDADNDDRPSVPADRIITEGDLELREEVKEQIDMNDSGFQEKKI